MGDATYSETVAAIEACLTANHANTLALIACLESCLEQQPYREAEETIDADPALRLSMQNAHALMALLVDCGGIEAVAVPEPDYDETEEKPDQPVDYLVQTTEAGRDVLDRFNPTRRLLSLIASEPAAYQPLYGTVLTLCMAGAKTTDISSALADEPALFAPKRIYPEYFVSKLETVGGISWNGMWNTTEAGKNLLAQMG